jgi:hypothetical protein
MDFYYTYLEGRITIEEKPKFTQRGDFMIMRSYSKYLCINVGKIENLIPPENIGIVNTFVTVHWGNQKSATRTILDNYSPTFNEEMYFKIALEKGEKDPGFFDEVRAVLKSTPEIVLYVWLDLGNGQCENIGYSKCTLSELQDQMLEEKGFYDFENKVQVKRLCRVVNARRRVVSSTLDNSNTHLNVSFWLIPDYPTEKIDVSELVKVEGDKMDPLVFKAIREGHESQPFKVHQQVVPPLISVHK